MITEIQRICDGIDYTRDIPEEAKKLAKENGFVIIVGGSDDLMYCYGAECYLTEYCEHSYGWDGNTLTGIGDKKLEHEARQLGLKIWWCGEIVKEGLKRENYSIKNSGAFSYTVDSHINHKNFIVFEDKEVYADDVYCTGIIIELPDGFTSSLKLEKAEG